MPAPPSAPESANAPLPASRPPARSIPESLPLLLFILVTPHLSFAAPHPSAVSDPGEPVIITALTFIPIPLVLYSSNAGGPQILYIQIWDNMFGSLIDWFSIASITLRPDGSGGVETGPWLFAPRVSNIELGRLSLAFGMDQERMVQTDGIWRPVAELRGEAGVYITFDKRGRFSFYPRFLVFSVFNDTAEKLGEPIRGIPDAAMDGSFALYLNQTLGIGLWQWKGVWDLQIHPWFDLALAHGGTRPFTTANDIRRSLGADILFFIERVPNLVFRFSWGFNLDPAVPWSRRGKREFIVRYSYSY